MDVAFERGDGLGPVEGHRRADDEGVDVGFVEHPLGSRCRPAPPRSRRRTWRAPSSLMSQTAVTRTPSWALQAAKKLRPRPARADDTDAEAGSHPSATSQRPQRWWLCSKRT